VPLFLCEVNMRETAYERKLKVKISNMFPGCFIQKNDPQRTQGILDFTIFYKDMWAMLEVKISETAPHRPNQDWWVEELSKHSFASFIYPENEDEVLNGLQHAFETRRASCTT